VTDFEHEVRRALRDLADEGRPVALGRRALDRVRRRRERRARAVSAAAAVALVAVAVPRLLGADQRPADPPPDLTGRTVIAAYSTATDARVLDRDTGRYRRTELEVESVAPDLGRAVGTREAGYPTTYPAEEPRLGVLDIGTGRTEWFPMSDPVADPQWSPDGRQVVARLGEPDDPWAVVLTPTESQQWTFKLAVPADQLLVSLCWSGVGRLLAVTVPEPGARSTGVRLTVLDYQGYVVRSMTVPADWTVTCAGRDGRVLASRLAGGKAGSVVPPEVAVVDLDAGRLGPPVRLPWAGSLVPKVWRTDRSFLAVSLHRLLEVDLDAGTVTQVRRAPRGVPGDVLGGGYAVFLSADGLERYAGDVADVSF
jgi:hypothetical protein